MALTLPALTKPADAQTYNYILQWGAPGAGSSQFNAPTGTAVDLTGNVYVADFYNNRVQKFSSAGVFISQWGVLGTGNGQFNGPAGIGVDANRQVYVADFNNNRIQVFDSTGAYLRQWGSSGGGNGQFGQPIGLAVDLSHNVYVADRLNFRIQKFTATGTFLAKWGTVGAGNGQFGDPVGVAVNGSRNVYVTDRSNNRVQEFDSLGVYIGQWGSAGSGNGQFNGTYGIALDNDGNVFVTDGGNNRVQKFDGAGGYLTQWGGPGAGNGQFNGPYWLAVDALGSVFVADQNNSRIQKFGLATTTTLSTALNPTGVGQPIPLTATVTPAGATGTVMFYDGVGLLGSASLVAGSATLSVSSLAVGSHSLTASYGGSANFVSSTSSAIGQTVIASQAPYSYVTQWGGVGGGDGQFGSTPGRLAYDASGNFYVVDSGFQYRVEKFNSAGVYLLQWGTQGSGNGQFLRPAGIAVDASGSVYVSDPRNNRIQKFTGTGAYITQWATSGSDLAVDGSGNVFVSDAPNNRIQKFTGTGTLLTEWGSAGSGPGQFATPIGLAVDASGNIYVVDSGNSRVQVFTGAGSYVRQWGSPGSGNGQFSNSKGIAVDGTGSVFVVDDNGDDRIQKFTNSGAYLTQWHSSMYNYNTSYKQSQWVVVDPSGAVYMTESAITYCVCASIVKYQQLQRLTSIADVPNDQGHQLRLQFSAHGSDFPGTAVPVVRYDVFRRANPFISRAPGANAPSAVNSSRPAAASPEVVQLLGWDYLVSVPAYGDPGYQVVVPTVADSNQAGITWSVFMVRAATATPSVYYDSPPDSGYSRDNLPPALPASFVGVYAPGTTTLHWGANSEPDLWYYRIHRGASADFVPGLANLIATRSDTGYVDAGSAGSYYKLSAVDVNGNESGYALLSPGGTTDVPGGPPLAFALEGVRPNPTTSGRMAVTFVLPIAAPARLELVDVRGRMIVVREVGSLGAGRHVVDTAGERRLPAGLYLVRLTQGGLRRTARAIVLD